MNLNKTIVLSLTLLLVSCGKKKKTQLTAQYIIDKSIEISGGHRYASGTISFDFREKTYILENRGAKRIMKRISVTDTAVVTDVKEGNDFQRFINDSLISLPDSLSFRFSNAVNSVHYFAYLPYKLNDPAVNKELLGEVKINGKQYHKIKVTFDKKGGGMDYDDIFLYWFDKETFELEYLAYKFYTNGGGMRFREAYNERFVNGIRFVDYNNYEPIEEPSSIFEIERLFGSGKLKLLSKIELKQISVRPDNYN